MRLPSLTRACLATSALIAASCTGAATGPGAPNGAWSLSSVWQGRVIIADDADGPRWPSDPVTIASATVKGDTLELWANYGGGCRAQSFLLLSDAAWMESYPVQASVRLARNAQGDTCEALLSRLLRFDLSPLKAAYNEAYHGSTGIIRLNLRGFSPVTYSW